MVHLLLRFRWVSPVSSDSVASLPLHFAQILGLEGAQNKQIRCKIGQETNNAVKQMAQKIVIWCPHVENSTQKNWTWALWPVVFKLNARSNTGSAAVFFVKTFFLWYFFFLVLFCFSFCAIFFISVVVGKESAPQTYFFLYVSFSFFWSLVQAWGDVKGCFFFRRVKEKDFKLIYKVGLFS